MKVSGLSSPRDFLALLVRRKWWIAVPFLTLSLAVALLTHFLPMVYVSESLTLIQPRGVPEDFVKDLIAGSTEQRLSTIEKTILSRTNLLHILHQFEGRLPELRRLNTDQQVIRLRSQIGVSFEAERRMGVQLPLTYFRISYQNQDPGLAQEIAGKLTTLFIEQDTRVRESKVIGTTEFLSTELEKIAEQLKISDATLKELKQRHQYELPDQLNTNLRTLDRLNDQKKANTEALDRSATLRLNLERLISETPALISGEGPAGRATPSKTSANPLVELYRKKELEYRQLTDRYKEKHPDVESAKAELERLKKEIPPEDFIQSEKHTPAGTAPVMVPNPTYQSLTSQMREVKTELDIREREKKWIELEIAKYSERVQNAPAREQSMAEVLRVNTELNKQYEDLRTKLAQAKMSQNLESGQRGSQFVVVDAANFPLLPTKPNKPGVVLAGIVLSLGVGIGIATVVDLLNQKIWTQSELEQLFNVTVIAEIPEIVTDKDLSLARKKRLSYAVLGVAFGSAYLGGLYFVYLHHGRVLNILDPIIQRVIYS